MTRFRHPLTARLAVPLLALLALAGCATTAGAGSTPTPTASSSGPCTGVTVVVDFGTFKKAPIHACAVAGPATDVLTAAHIATAGSADYGDQAICRVDDLPSPADESCAKLPSDAYWALWVRDSSAAKWEYAQVGVTALQLTAGQSLGLVYTHGSDSTPPAG